MVEIKSTLNYGDHSGINVLLYGMAGIGKTRSLSECPEPIILAAESGLVSLRTLDVKYEVIDSIKSLRDVYAWLCRSEEGQKFKTVCVDSITEVGDIAHADAKRRVGNLPAKLYPETRSMVLPLLKAFRALPRHFVAIAHQTDKTNDEVTITCPSMVGSRLTDDLPYLFDVVCHFKRDNQGNRVAVTDGSGSAISKDRSGALPGCVVYDDPKSNTVLSDMFNAILTQRTTEDEQNDNE